MGLLSSTVPQQFPQLWGITTRVLMSGEYQLLDNDGTDAGKCKAAQRHLQAVLQGSAVGQAWSVREVRQVWHHDPSGRCILTRVQ